MSETVKKWIIRISYTVVMAGICCAVISVYACIRTSNDYEGKGKYEMISAAAEKIGDQYGDRVATKGESFYRVSVKVKNTGQYTEKSGSVYFQFTTDDGKTCMKEYDTYDVMKWEAMSAVPAGRTAEVENIVQIPDESRKLSVTFGTNTDGTGSAEVLLSSD